MRIAVVGVGGTGGYFDELLARAGEDVTFIARGAMLAALRRRVVPGDDGEHPAERLLALGAFGHVGVEVTRTEEGARIRFLQARVRPGVNRRLVHHA